MREKLSLIVIVVCVPFLLLPQVFGVRMYGEEQGIPLLTVLLMSEFGFVLCAAGGFAATRSIRQRGYRHSQGFGLVACAVLALLFLWVLIRLYPAGA